MLSRNFKRYTLNEFTRLVLQPAINQGVTFTEVHVHGTWKPTIAQHRKDGGLKLVQAMWRFHTGTQKWSDIAQHATIDPDGYIWEGRSLLRPPASSTNYNDSDDDCKHPFMFEMIGNFDKGAEKLEGAQLETSAGLCRAIMDLCCRDTDMIHFHREMDTHGKTCPGSGIEKEWFIEHVKPSVDLSKSVTVCVTVNGENVGNGFLLNGVTYVPARATVTPLGAQITFDAKTQTVNINI